MTTPRTRSFSVLAVGVVVAVLLQWLLAPAGTRAGARSLGIILVNMSPPGVGSVACIRDIKSRLQEGDVLIRRFGESRFRRIVEAPPGDFMDWSAAGPPLSREDLLLPFHRDEPFFAPDSLVLVDCRPELKRLDVLVTSSAGEPVRIRLRAVPIDRERARWIAAPILQFAWVGFVP